MSSSNMRKKEYAKKLLKKHVSSFYKDDTLENKYSIVSTKGMTKVDDKLIKYLTKETGLSTLQANDLVINDYNDSKAKLDTMRKDKELRNKIYIDKYNQEKRKQDKKNAYKVYNRNNSIKTRNNFFDIIERNNSEIERIFNPQYRLESDLNESGEIMQSGYEIIQEMEFLLENYDITAEEAFEIVSEGKVDRTSKSFIQDVREEYSHLKKEKPALAAAIKGFVYPFIGGTGGFIHGAIKYDRELNKKNGNADPYIILKQTLKGMGYRLLASLITPVGTAALSVASQKRKESKEKKLREEYGVYKEDGELYIENEVIYAITKEYNIYPDEAIDLIMEAYEEELLEDDIIL